jgi:hypothetical protein
MRGRLVLLAAVMLVAAACNSDGAGSTTVADAPLPEQFFFVGDSNLDRIPTAFVALAEARQPDLTIDAQASVTFGVPLSVGFDGRTRRIQDGTFDVVVLEEDLEVNDPVTFMGSVRNFNNEITTAGAETVLYMPWEHDTSDHDVSIADIASVYTSIGDELGVKVAPVGLAFTSSMLERPDLDLYIGDREHSNFRGHYLAAAVLYATIFDTSPEGPAWISQEMAEEAEMTEEDAAFLDQIAWQTVTEYRQATSNS